ncbi:MAG: TerB family tellurite resistance protein [Cyanobacteria bacterium P01_H01_bin.121]
MSDNPNRTLLKILIGAAWIDGEVQAEERQYLQKMAQEQGLTEDPEIRPLLFELVQVQPEQCYTWIEEYLGPQPADEAYQTLLESISALIYSDGSVAIEEARLLTHLQAAQGDSNGKTRPTQVLQAVQSLYRKWVGDQP